MIFDYTPWLLFVIVFAIGWMMNIVYGRYEITRYYWWGNKRNCYYQYTGKPIAKTLCLIPSDLGIEVICKMNEPKEAFKGCATIKVRFRSLEQYKEFRFRVLKTGWMTADNYPAWEEIEYPITNYDDVQYVAKTIFSLLQYGFEVYACRFRLEEQMVETEHPEDDESEDDDSDENDVFPELIRMGIDVNGDEFDLLRKKWAEMGVNILNIYDREIGDDSNEN